MANAPQFIAVEMPRASCVALALESASATALKLPTSRTTVTTGAAVVITTPVTARPRAKR
jgi:hypothetical protein